LRVNAKLLHNAQVVGLVPVLDEVERQELVDEIGVPRLASRVDGGKIPANEVFVLFAGHDVPPVVAPERTPGREA